MENRRIGLQTAQLTQQNGRLRAASTKLHAEMLALSQLLEPLHIMNEQFERQQRAQASLLEANAQLQHRAEAAMQEANARLHLLQQVYSSRSWFLTKPWRFAGRVAKRLMG